MSAVFMCDNCGELFSANAEGWRVFSEEWDGDARTRPLYHNGHNHGMMQRHIGPCCSLKSATPKPRLALPSGDDS